MAIFAAFSLSAQTGDEILSKIEAACAKGVNNIDHSFTEVKTPAPTQGGKVHVHKSDGKLTYKDGTLTMNYTNGNFFKTDDKKMTVTRGKGKQQEFDLTKNKMMKNLSDALRFCFDGKIKNLASEQNANILASKKGNEYVITISAKQKSARGYNMITITYNAKNCAIKTMKMDEFNGTSTFYSVE